MREVYKGIKRIQLDIPFIMGKMSPFRLRCNVYAIKTESGIVLFDCGPKEAAQSLQLALPAERVSVVFLTHGHADHAGSGKYWIERGAMVIAPQDECPMLRAGGPEVAPAAFKYPPFEPSGTVKPGDRVTPCKEFEFLVLATPGHTPGSVCYYDEQNDILICGDLLFGPIWGYMVTFLLEFLTAQRQSDIDIRRQIESLEKLVNTGVIKNTTLILPGHGPGYYMQEKPSAVKRSSGLLRLCLRL